jgi:hypothetical protein
MVATDACEGETPAAWTSPVTWPRPIALSTKACTSSQRRYIDGLDAHVVSRVAEDFRCGIRILLPFVSEQHMLAEANTSRDGLADLPGSDNDEDFVIGRIAHH